MDKQKTKKAAPQIAGRITAFLMRLMSKERVHIIVKGIERFALCAILSRGEILGGYAPFGLAMGAALMARGAGLSVVSGVFFGTMLLGGAVKSGIYAAAVLLVLCVMSILSGLKIVQKSFFAPLVGMIAGAACTFVFLPSVELITAAEVITFVSVQLITFGTCYVYGIALAPPSKESDVKRPITLLALSATILLSFSDFAIFSLITPARVIALLFVLSAAFLCGAPIGAAVGVAFGAAMDLASGQGALFTCAYGLLALVSGLFKDSGKAWFSVCALAAGICSAMLGTDNVLFVPLILEVICAVSVFALFPPFVWTALRETVLPKNLSGETAHHYFKETASKCMGEVSSAFYELYLAMLNGAREGKAAGDDNISTVFDRASDRVCKKCVLCSQCWQRDYITTLAALNDVTAPMLKRGRAEMSDFPKHFASRCVKLPELILSINHALFALRERESMRRQQEENQTLLARQYAGITDILRQFGAEVSQDFTAQPRMEQQIRRYTAAFGWIDRVCALKDSMGRTVIELYGEGTEEILASGEGFSAGLSALLGVSLSSPKAVSGEQGSHLVLKERAPYRVIVGIGKQQKNDATVSGDSGCYFVTEAGIAAMLIADGMGTGAAASQDSRTLVTMMERFLRAGITSPDALKAISPAFRLRSDGKRFVTLDALTVDLFSGKAENLKCGAAPSYVRMGGKWSVLENKTLPIGLMDETHAPETIPLRFEDGDMFVQVSDGISDGKEDEWLKDILKENGKESPKEIAARLIAGASEHHQEDDKTVLVMRVEKR